MTVDQYAATNPYYAKLKKLLDIAEDNELYSSIVNSPFKDKKMAALFHLGVVVFLLVNKQDKTIDRIALSDTYSAKGAVLVSAKPFKEIRIPVNEEKNIISKAIKTGEPQLTHDWKYLFVPELTAQDARFNQASAGIGCSAVYPLIGNFDGGAIIFSYYQPPEKIGAEHHDFMNTYAKLVSNRLSS
jgi:hypothetical protein